MKLAKKVLRLHYFASTSRLRKSLKSHRDGIFVVKKLNDNNRAEYKFHTKIYIVPTARTFDLILFSTNILHLTEQVLSIHSCLKHFNIYFSHTYKIDLFNQYVDLITDKSN